MFACIVFQHDRKNEKDQSFTMAGPSDFCVVDDKENDLHEAMFTRPFVVPPGEEHIPKLIGDVVKNHKDTLDKHIAGGMTALKAVAEQHKGKETFNGGHCSRSFELKPPLKYDLPNVDISEVSHERGLVRVFQAEKLSMNGKAFSLHGTAGFAVVLRGWVVVAVLQQELITGEQDVMKWLQQEKEKAIEDIPRAVLGPGDAMFVPYGSVGVMMGLSEKRSTAVTVVEEAKGRPNKKKDSSVDEIEYIATAWLPCYSVKDADYLPAVRRSVLARLQHCSADMSAPFKSCESWKNYMSFMQQAQERDDDAEKKEEEGRRASRQTNSP